MKSGRESRRRGRNSAGDARERAPAKCERQLGKHGGGQWHSEIEIAGALRCAGSVLLPSPVLSPPSPAVFLRYACVLPRSTPAPLPALCSRSLQHYTGVPLRATPALDFALRRRFALTYAGALCRRQRYSLCFVALPRPSAAPFPTLCRHLGMPRPLERARARSRLILVAAGLLVGEPRGEAGYGARYRNRTILWYSQRRLIKFPAHHRASDTGGIGPKIVLLLHIIAGLSIFHCLNYHTLFT